MNKELLRNLPKVDELVNNHRVLKESKDVIRTIVVDAVRETIDFYRNGILKGQIVELRDEEIVNTTIELIRKKDSSKLRRVINATGTVIHTNLGRSLLSKAAMENVLSIAENYSNLEYDIENGKRGSRYSHIEELIVKITGAEAAVVVNNNAAAVMLVLNTLSKGKEAVVSRGQLVEIGGSFRIPEVMKFSDAKLVEVGTTNRTHLYDYENVINENTGVLLKVHTSNYKILGFTDEVEVESMVDLGNRYNLPVYEDIGSGVLVDYTKYGFTYEPTVQESIKRGIDVVSFSGDKMLGGPQAGIIVGKKKYIDMMKKNQLTRALRVDKMTLAALEGTLKYYLDEKEAIANIPTLQMLLTPLDELKRKAIKFKRKLSLKTKLFEYKIDNDFSMVGGGSMPTEKIKTYVIKVSSSKISSQELESRLRLSNISIVGRVNNNELILDLRTIDEKEFDIVINALMTIENR